MMFGPLLLLAASVSPPAPAAPATPRVSQFRPTGRATARATVSITVISGVRFGAEQVSGDEGAVRRKARIADADGVTRAAELLEFQ
jgi:hypothetical protein